VPFEWAISKFKSLGASSTKRIVLNGHDRPPKLLTLMIHSKSIMIVLKVVQPFLKTLMLTNNVCTLLSLARLCSLGVLYWTSNQHLLAHFHTYPSKNLSFTNLTKKNDFCREYIYIYIYKLTSHDIQNLVYQLYFPWKKNKKGIDAFFYYSMFDLIVKFHLFFKSYSDW